MEPQQIGRYLIQERLGQGGMGTVYRALDPRVNRLVALKAIPITDPDRRARFQREVWAAGRLIHPHIVTLFDAGEEGDVAYIVMELVEGETLATRLRRDLTWRQAVPLLTPICRALHYAHSQGVTHRDLKPANLLITRQGVPKLSDFGLAHVATDPTLTPSGAALGTPGYTAPEQLRGEKPDNRSDLFSLGVILFEAVAGQHPFEADSVNAMLYQITSEEPVDLEPLVGKAPPALAQVIGQALAKDRKARYATCDELATALRSCLSQEEVEPDIPPHPMPDTYPSIRHTPSVSLSEAELHLFEWAFPDSEEVFIERELHAGLSGARVLLVRPGSSQAQVVVKLGPSLDLYREWDAYRALVEDYSPQNTARVQGEPILSEDGEQALLRYTFAGGDPRRPTRGLRTYYQEQGGSAAVEVLNRVIRVYGRQWWSQSIPRTFALSEEYDRLLPVHLKLRPIAGGEAELHDADTSLTLTAGKTNALALRALRPGQRIRLLNFSVSEVRSDKGDMTLTTPPPQGEASAYLRLRVEGIDPTLYRSGGQVDALDGVITATRHSLLVEAAQSAISGLNPEVMEVRLGDKTRPNPLRGYDELLDHVTDARFSIIHGDLNLENILVDSDTGFAWLIDFADTRQGPALYDLQRLEGQVITRLLPPAVSQAGLGPEVMIELYHALHAEFPDPTAPHPDLQEPYTLLVAIRRLARQFLMNDVDWDEYYRGLILTLLGTLKFAELEAAAHALAFAGAAAARGLISTPLPTTPVPHQRKSALARYWPVVVVLASLLLVTVLAALDWPLLPRGEQPSGAPLAIIAGMAGRVEVRRQADDRVQPATFGLDLFREDAVLTYEGAAANVLCQNGLLFNLGPQQVLVVRCQETDDTQLLGRLDPQLSAGLIQASREITITLAPAGARAARTDIGRVPVLVGPRNTAIAEPRPTWRWEEMAGAEGYRLAVVNAVTGERWQTETTATELAYPDDAPPLVPNTTYLTRLELIGATAPADESFFFLLDEASQSEVMAAEEAIRVLSLDPATEGFLLAGIYGEQGLWDTAIKQLESIVEEEERPGLDRHLGDLYFQVGLLDRAERSYQAALAEAQLADDPQAQAGALVGLGRVADAYGEREAAIGHFQTAEALYRTAGNTAQAEVVAQVLTSPMEGQSENYPTLVLMTGTPTTTPEGFVILSARLTGAQDVRQGPGEEYAVFDQISAGTIVEVTGRNQKGTWWQIVHPSGPGGRGWIDADYVEPEGEGTLYALAVVLVTPPTTAPAPTSTPRRTSTRPPTATQTFIPATSLADTLRTPTLTPTRATPWPAPTPAANCPDPHVTITYPTNGAIIQGIVPFIGTADSGDLQYYKFEYRPLGAPNWEFLAQFDHQRVTNGTLMDWHTYTVAPGTYDIRLIVVGMSGNYPPPCEIRVTVTTPSNPAVEPTPMPSCPINPAPEFQPLWNTHRSELGCATGSLLTIPFIAEEAFEGGHLFWREDTDDVYLIYDRRKDGAELFEGEWTMPLWKWDGAELCEVSPSPPPGLQKPERGFSWLWCAHLGGPDGPLGWALDREYGRENLAIVQPFEYGLIFRASDPKVYSLLDDGRFFARR